ncbi:MAG: D-alanyl-D-alanine carboxypeptidase family protein [Pseudomonadota bacterium]
MTWFTRRIRAAALCALAAGLGPSAAAADDLLLPLFDTTASHAIILDGDTGAVLMSKNADAPIPPASMSKLMTAEVVFQALKQGRRALDEVLPVSEEAFRKEGSTMYLNLGDDPTIADLLRGLIVQSGNDASIALAEGMAGTEARFAELMTRRAREIGLTNSRFANASGLPAPNHEMSVRDLAVLARHIIYTYPDYYTFYQEREFTWAGVTQRNRNPLLALEAVGGDGLKTGFTEEAGFGIVGSAERDGRRVIAVLAGLDSRRARSREVVTALNWGFREFEPRVLAEKGAVVGAVDVWIGSQAQAQVALAEDLKVVVPVLGGDVSAARIVYEGPVAAPVAVGDRLATLRVEVAGVGPVEAALTAAEAVEKGGYLARLSAGFGFAARWAWEQARAQLFGGEAAEGDAAAASSAG